MYRLNVNVTEEVEQIIKAQAKRYGCGMGTIVNMWALNSKLVDTAMAMPISDMLAEMGKDKPNRP